MASIDYGRGEMPFRCTAWTAVLYEQQFQADKSERITGDLIADVMGKVIVSSNDLLTINEDGAFVTTVVDYTRINWNATMRAFWAMLRTSSDIAESKGLPHVTVPGFKEWQRSLMECEPDMQALHLEVANELQRGLFRSGAAASGKTSDGE